MKAYNRRSATALILGGLLFSTSAFAADLDLTRFQEANDLMPAQGKYAGQKIENEMRRSLVLLNAKEKQKLGIPSGTFAFANFRHNQKFYIAEIPGISVDADNHIVSSDQLISKVEYDEKHWAQTERPQTKDIEVHSTLVFNFAAENGVHLVYDQSGEGQLITSAPQVINQIVLSVESDRSENSPDAGFIPDALGPNFAVVHRIVSLDERDAQDAMSDPGRVMQTLPLNLAKTRSLLPKISRPEDALLIASLTSSVTYGRKETYMVIGNNCMNKLFDLFDSTLKYNQESTGKINTQIITQGARRFQTDELPQLLLFAATMAQDALTANGGPTTSADLSQLIGVLTGEMNTDIKKMQTGTMPHPEKFMDSIPAMISPHLQARGLINYSFPENVSGFCSSHC